MFAQGPQIPPTDLNEALVRQYDGAERIHLLPHAQFITLAPSTDPDEPVDVTIEWHPGRVEKPLPGSALWRAVLKGRLRMFDAPGPAQRLIRHQVKRSLERFPNLESWWKWVRSGWTAPPTPAAKPSRQRTLRALLERFRRP